MTEHRDMKATPHTPQKKNKLMFGPILEKNFAALPCRIHMAVYITFTRRNFITLLLLLLLLYLKYFSLSCIFSSTYFVFSKLKFEYPTFHLINGLM